MSKIVGFKMGKGITAEDKATKTWSRRYLELEVEWQPGQSTESLPQALARAENTIDFWLGQPGPEQEEVGIPSLDLEEINGLPWKGKGSGMSTPSAWGWIYGPAARMGTQQGAEKLAEAIEKAADHKLQLGNMEYIFSKDKTFINRKPVKQESAT